MRRWIPLFLLVLLVAGRPVAQAAIDIDRVPPMSWDELVGCELVVIARYHSHEGRTLLLRVERVLKGEGVKAGDIISVALQHRYSMQTGPTGFESWMEKKKPDGIPKLCYSVQLCNPGPVVPCEIAADVRKANLYFFPKAKGPVLRQSGQVQLPLFADCWEQAATGRPADLLFRLLQRASGKVQAEAIEELYRSRDAKVIRQLVEWTIRPPVKRGTGEPWDILVDGSRTLARVGDRDGDVYDPLWAWLTGEGRHSALHDQKRVARTLAWAAPERAFRELSALIRTAEPWQREVAVRALPHVRTEAAVALCITLLEDPALAPIAIAALDESFRYHRHESDRGVGCRLRGLVRARLLVALGSPRIRDEHKEKARGTFAELLRQRPGLDPTETGKKLLDPQTWKQPGRFMPEADRILEAIKEDADPRFVPLLVRLLREPPIAIVRWYHIVDDPFGVYASLYPNAMRAEMARRGIDRAYVGSLGDSAHALRDDLRLLLASPRTDDELGPIREIHGDEWLTRHGASPALVKSLKAHVERTRESGPHSPWLWRLFLADREEASKIVEWHLERRDLYTHPRNRANLLAIAVRLGHHDLVDELCREVDGAIAWERQRGEQIPTSARLLLRSDHPKALRAYLERLDARPVVTRSKWAHHLHVDFVYDRMLGDLEAGHPREYYARILKLAESERVPARKRAEKDLHWLGYWADDFSWTRKETLARIRSAVEALGWMSKVQRLGLLLSHRAVELPGPPGEAWLPGLVRAAGQPDYVVSNAALEAISALTTQERMTAIRNISVYERERIVRHWLADRGVRIAP